MMLPELLSPAGSAPSMVAAVQCGADAVYLGAGDFNARRTADNFGGELDAAVLYCHARGVKVYVTLNTVVRQDELSRLENTIREIALAGADGVIVQDFGVTRAVRQMAPTLPLHASTQMAVHNPQGVEFLVRQGFRRVVLAREMPLEEIRRCAGLGAELEVFVHGALCVSCSGQCLMSSMIGGRSGNRGMCAQPCRMPYRLDGKSGYLLSTKDLCGLYDLRALTEAGASSLKIEGRLKRPEYVAVTTNAYRNALDALASGKPFDADAAADDLRQIFNRGGFTRGYFGGVDDADLMYARQPNHIGVEIGVCRRNGEIELAEEFSAKDALVLRRANADDLPVSASDMRIPRRANADGLPVSVSDVCVGRFSLTAAKKGDRLVRLVSQAQMDSARALFARENKKAPVDMRLTLNVGEPARLSVTDGAHTVEIAGDTVQTAQSKPLDASRVRAQIEKLGDLPVTLRDYRAEIGENAFLPISALNALRRTACERLLEARGGKPHACAAMEIPSVSPIHVGRPVLIAQSASPDVLRIALESGCERAAFAPEDLRIDALNDALARLPERFSLVLPPVASENTLRALNDWANANAKRIDATYISNIGQVGLRWSGRRIADSSMNAANNLAVSRLNDWGFDAYTPSLELNCAQLRALGGRRELIVYGRIPLMQLRHCPLRAVQGLKGKHADCRRCDGCEPDQRLDAKRLTDRTGAAFPLRRIASDDGCVIRLLNSAVLMPLKKARMLPDCEDWRLLLDADDPVKEIVRLYDLARKGLDPRTDGAWKKLETTNTTSGHYFRGVE